ncbi:MAG: 4'-phosphopantetheinyl transferase superfamily protein [Polyangiales bacterium]
MPLDLDDHGLDLWLLPTPSPSDDDERRRGLAWMSPDERDRHASITHPQARDEHLRARRLVRGVLSRYAEVAPSDWRFRRNEHGRPFVAAPSPSAPLHFNLSHTRGLVAMTVSRSEEAACDVEWHPRRGDPLGVAHRYFAPAELRDLRAVAPERQRARFFTLWTLKESYIKARSMGLAIPLRHFSFRVGDDETPQGVDFAPGFDDRAERWWFARRDPTPEHALSLAWSHPTRPAPSPTLRTRWLSLDELG